MDLEIKDRKLSSVTIGNVDMDWLPEGAQRIGGMCSIALTDHTGGEHGPVANIFFGVGVDPSKPLRDVPRAILERAHEILQRMAALSTDELETCFVEWRAKAVAQQKEAARSGFPIPERG